MRGCENDVRIQLFLMYLSHVHKTPDAFVIKVIKTDLTNEPLLYLYSQCIKMVGCWIWSFSSTLKAQVRFQLCIPKTTDKLSSSATLKTINW